VFTITDMVDVLQVRPTLDEARAAALQATSAEVSST
jgi:hypothetical protein